MSTNSDWESEVKELTKKAEKEDRRGNAVKSIEYYKQAVDLVPDPFEESPYAMQFLSAIAEQYYQSGDLEQAFDYYSQAVRAKGGLGWGPFHLRLGQLRYGRGEMDRAKDELMRAYMGNGDLIFESEDPKYFELIKDIVEKK